MFRQLDFAHFGKTMSVFTRRKSSATRTEDPETDKMPFDESILMYSNSFQNGPFKNAEKQSFKSIDLKDLLCFDESDVFDIPPVARKTLEVGPLNDVDINGVYMPHIVDSISAALTSV